MRFRLSNGTLARYFVVLALLIPTLVYAQPEGPNNSTNIRDGGGGQINEVWMNPNLARTQSDTYGSLVTTTKNKRTNYLQAQNFGFAIPTGSSIDGILVEVERYATATGGSVDDERIRIIDATGTIDAGSDQSTGLTWPTSDTDTYQSYGGATDLWTITDWTSAKINNSNFGVALVAKTSNDNTTFNLFVDHIRITIYYTVSGSQRYAVATGDWDATSTWATAPGGTPGAAVPTSTDDVFIGGGWTVNQNVNGAECNSLTIGTGEATPTGTLTFDSNNEDITIGSGGLVITADGDVIGANSPTLTTVGDFTINSVLTNRAFEVRMETTDGLIIDGTGTIGILNIRSQTTNTADLTITGEFDGDGDDKLVNGATASIVFSGTTMGREIDLSTPGNTIEFAHTIGDGDFDITKSGTLFHYLIISGDANKSYNGDITVNGDLTITASGILSNANKKDITLLGNWTNNNGATGFVPNNGNSTVIFSGGNGQSITNSSGEVFYRIEVNKTAGTTVSGLNDITVEDRFLMTEGVFDAGSNALDGAGDLTMDNGELIIGTISTTVPELTGTYNINAGTITFNGSGSQTIRSTTSTPSVTSYTNVNFNGSGSKTLEGTIDVDGDLTIGGTATLDVSASNFGIILAGDWTNTSTFSAQNGIVTLNGASSQNVTNASGETFFGLTINNATAGSAIVLGGDITVNDVLTLTDGHVLSTSTNLLNLGSSATVVGVSDASHVDGPVSKTTVSTTKFDFPIGDGTNYQPSSITPTATTSTTFVSKYFIGEQSQGTTLGTGIDHISSQDYWTINRTAGAANAAVTLSWEYSADPEIDNLPELLVAQWSGTSWDDQGNAGTSGNAFAGTITSNTISSFTTEYFVLASSTTNNPLSINRYFVAATGNWDDAGVWSFSSGGPGGAPEPTATKNAIIETGNVATILDNTAGQAAVSVLTLNVIGTLTMANNAGRDVTVAVGDGGFILANGADITGSDDDEINMSGDIVLNNATSISHTALETNFDTQGNEISGTGSLPILNVNQNNQNNVGSVSFTDLIVGSDWTNDGTITITGDFTGGGDLTNNATGTIVFSGTTYNGNIVASTVGNTVRVVNNTGADIDLRDGVSASTYHNLTVGGADNHIFGGDLNVNGNLTIEAGAVIDQANDNKKLNVGGNWVNNNGTGGFLQGTNDVTFNGSSAQSVSISSGNEVFEDLIINNSSSTGVTLLSGEVHIDNSLALSDGIVFTDATNILVIEDNATSDEGSAASFVDGPMTKIGNDAFVFPMGDASTWARLAIESLANFDATTEFTCQYLNSTYVNTVDLDTDVNNVSTVEHWLLTRDLDPGDDASCNVRIYWEDVTASNIQDLADLRVGHFYNSGSGDMWHNFGGSYVDNGDGSGEIVSTTTFTSFSPITFASEFGFNALPVELVNFEGRAKTEVVELAWTTASELNNDYFEVEVSPDAKSFATLGKVEGNGSTAALQHYQFTDFNPGYGLNYYRLRQVNYDGAFEYSNIIAVKYDGLILNSLKVYPNPNHGREITVLARGFISGTMTIEILDLNGQVVFFKKADRKEAQNGQIHLNLQDGLSPGVYILKSYYNEKISTSKFLVK